ncbi:MAG: NUDIX domain-containing protein [archaeon]|nr:NUDIX domain-containing protein [archaeon]
MSKTLEDQPNQEMILVDAHGNETGYILDRKTCHSTPGIKHLAIQVLVFNANNELILHERPLKKVGGGVLDSPTTHVLNKETKEEAGKRCLNVEYGIPADVEIKVLRGFSYEKDYGDGSCENEFCLAAFISYSGEIKPNSEHAGKIVNVHAKQVLEELDSEKYPVWFKEAVKIVAGDEKGKVFFD